MKQDKRPDKPADPDCSICDGLGFIYNKEGWSETCTCRYNDEETIHI